MVSERPMYMSKDSWSRWVGPPGGLRKSGRSREVAVRRRARGEQHLQALGSLGATCFAQPQDLFDHGLDLLVRHLRVDRAMVSSVTGRGVEHLWCAGAPADLGAAAPPEHDPSQPFCSQVLAPPEATLVIPDARIDPGWAQHPVWRSLGIRAFVGAPLRSSGKPVGVLSVQSESAHVWRASEVALVDAMAALFGQALEVEALKAKLGQTQEALELAAAVVQDSAMESPGTGLPTRRYLEVWSRGCLEAARRHRELLSLVAWTQPPSPGREEALGRLAGSLRAVDLLADLGQDRFLLVLPRTLRAGAERVLERFRRVLGPLPMGATLWNPLLSPDRDGPALRAAIRRAQAAIPAGQAGAVAWTFLEAGRENPPAGATGW